MGTAIEPVTRPFELTPPSEGKQVTPSDLLSLALQNNSAIDVIERISELMEKSVSRQAEIDFNISMNGAQSELVRIAPDLTNPQTHSKYASYPKLDKVVRPIYIKHGFSLSFNTEETQLADTVCVVCYVSHSSGHSRTYRLNMPADGKGAKGGDVMTKTHATGSAMQYGMRYLLKLIFNIAVGVDDDGNGSDSANVPEDWLADQIEEIGRCESKEGVEAAFKASAAKALNAGDIKAYKALREVMAARKKAL